MLFLDPSLLLLLLLLLLVLQLPVVAVLTLCSGLREIVGPSDFRVLKLLSPNLSQLRVPPLLETRSANGPVHAVNPKP